jgi:ubiquinone/menaquinone biosynthesis C-methylase UbiE
VTIRTSKDQALATHEIKSIYDRAYGERGLMGTHFDREYSSATKSTLISYCEAAPNPRLLDVGTGDGDLWEFVDSSKERYGIDISEVGVKTAVSRFAGVHGSVGVAEHLPYPDRFFGAVVAADTLEHTIDLDASLVEIRRVLAPGGLFAFSVPAPDSLRKWGYNNFVRQRPQIGKAVRLAGLVLKRTLMFGRADFQPIDRDMSLEEWAATIEQAGFELGAREKWPTAPYLPIVYLMFARAKVD